MTLDNIIEGLHEAREELGGDTDIRVHLQANGNGDFVDINEILVSKIFGLRFEVSTPWWAYKGVD